MKNNNKEELDTINRMYESGKITAEDRDKLIAAINAAAEAEAADDKADESFLSGLKDLGEQLKELNGLNELEGLKELGKIFEKSKNAIKRGAKAATVVLKNDMSDDGNNVSIVINDDDGEAEHTHGVVIKKKSVKYNTPYEKLLVRLKYINRSTVLTIYESAENTDKILEQCEEYLDEESLKAVTELINAKFTGAYKRVKNPAVLKLSVAPDGDDECDEADDD